MSRPQPHQPHLRLITPDHVITSLAPVTSQPGVRDAVIAAAVQWASTADALAHTMGWTPSLDSDLGQATLRLLDAVHTLEARNGGGPDPAAS